MARGIFVIGTDTDVGKTFVTAGITYILRKNCYNACSFKAIASGGVVSGKKIISEDVEFVKNITGLNEDQNIMNAYCLKTAVSPHLAAKLEGVVIKKKKILNTYHTLAEKYDYIVAEGAGGIVVPLIDNNYFIYNLIQDLKIPVVIVARAGVGTINHTVLTAKFAESRGIEIKGIIINGYEGSYYEDDNIESIENLTGLKILAVINNVRKVNEVVSLEIIKVEYDRSIDINSIVSAFL